MYLLLSRDGSPPRVTTSFEKTCRSVSWRVWCPIDIVLWATIVLVLALLFWKLYRKKGGDSDEPRMSLPLNAGFQADADVSIKNNANHCPCCVSDPRLIVNSQEGSIITKDVSILSTPARALLANTPKKSSSGQLTGLGISFGSTSMTDLPFHIPQMQGTSRQGSSTDLLSPSVIMAGTVETGNKPTPPPAYVRDIHMYTDKW